MIISYMVNIRPLSNMIQLIRKFTSLSLRERKKKRETNLPVILKETGTIEV